MDDARRTRKPLRVDLRVSLIQQVRLLHALTEGAFEIELPEGEIAKFDCLNRRFGVTFATPSTRSVDLTGQLTISHEEPVTAIGGISRPLLFPRAMVAHCRSLWPKDRGIACLFLGLITSSRRGAFASWAERNEPRAVARLPDPERRLYRVRDKLYRALGFENSRTLEIGNLLLVSNDRGRKFPIKAWDDEYYRRMAHARFALCPRGDKVWSYRFFEAVLCGAVPIVEEPCDAFEGFRFARFSDHLGEPSWSREDAEFNYDLCIERLTVPERELNEELARIAGSPG